MHYCWEQIVFVQMPKQRSTRKSAHAPPAKATSATAPNLAEQVTSQGPGKDAPPPPPWMAHLLQTLDKKINQSVQAAVQAPLVAPSSTVAPLPGPPTPTGPSQPTDLAQGAYTSSLASITAMSGTLGSDSNSGFVSTAVDITSQVPMKTKLKIWGGEFIDLRLLLPGRQQESFTLQVGDREGTPALQLVPQRKESPMSVGQWIKAWNRFVAVLPVQKPEQTAGLAQHMETVLELADRKGGWLFYDEQFRQMVVRNEIGWGSTHLELYMKAVLDNGTASVEIQNRQQTTLPRGACFKYHTTGQCSAGASCRFQHKCYTCLQQHPIFRCSQPHPAQPRILARFLTPAKSAPSFNSSPAAQVTAGAHQAGDSKGASK